MHIVSEFSIAHVNKMKLLGNKICPFILFRTCPSTYHGENVNYFNIVYIVINTCLDCPPKVHRRWHDIFHCFRLKLQYSLRESSTVLASRMNFFNFPHFYYVVFARISRRFCVNFA